MSIPYLVPKEDVPNYELYLDRLKVLQRKHGIPALLEKKYKITTQEEFDIYILENKDTLDQFEKEAADLEKELPVRIVQIFNKQPADIHNYVTYLEDKLWGEAAGCALMQVSMDGFNRCKEIVKK